jgi:hypothetical protein
MKEVTCFDDLEFRQHPNGMQGCVSAKHDLPNGITISVIGGDLCRFYGDGINSFEIAAWQTNGQRYLCLTDITHHSGGDDVLGWLDKEEITEVIQILLDYQIENPDEVFEDNG